jgi:hypothetical protein
MGDSYIPVDARFKSRGRPYGGGRLLSMPSVEEGPEEIARWIAERTGGPVPRFEKVEPGDEQILEDREQRELAVPSFLALSDDEEASDEPETPYEGLAISASRVPRGELPAPRTGACPRRTSVVRLA